VELLEHSDEDVIAKYHPIKSSELEIASLIINRPRSLNALTFDMLKTIYLHLETWKKKENIVLITLSSSQDRAFCSGGDIRNIRAHVLANEMQQVSEFFELEYSVDELIHRYPKPIVAFGKGVIMGGGVGLFVGASHRVMYKNSFLSMPEVSIGFFPDVGASWFLNRMPIWLGRFIALTATPLTPEDALFSGLTDYILQDHYTLNKFLKQCSVFKEQRKSSKMSVEEYISELLEFNQIAEAPNSHIASIWHLIQNIGTQKTLDAFIKKLQIMHQHSPILEAACIRLRQASPRSLRETWNLLNEQRFCSLSACFDAERYLSQNLCKNGDFCEGVRAKIIDKDHQPSWQD
jgi:enoyl-CoA hydratase/carnithine racemase